MTLSPQDWDDPYALPRKPMSPGVPLAGLPGASTYGGFQPGQDTSWGDWWRTPLPDSAFNPQVTSSGATGMGDSAQPEANTRASGSLGGAAKTMGPPPVPQQSPASVAPVPSAPVSQSPDVSAAQGPPPVPQRMPNPMQEAIDRAKGALAEAPPKPGEHWYQRLGMAMLAATKLATYAQQIVHPVWSQQMAAREGTEKELKELTSAQEAQSRGAYYQQQADESKGRYLKVGTGVFDQEKGIWVTMPVDKSTLVSVPAARAAAAGLDVSQAQGGRILLPPSTANQILKPAKDVGGMYVSEKEGKAAGIQPDEDGLYYVPKEGVASYVGGHFKPPAAPTAEGQKIAQQNAIKKMEMAGERIPADAFSDNAKLIKAFRASKVLTPEDIASAVGFQGVNTTPAAQGSTATIRVEGMERSRIQDYVDTLTNQMLTMNAEEFNAANRAAPGRYVGRGGAVPAMKGAATFGELEYSVKQAEQALPALGTLDAGTRAQLVNALDEKDSSRGKLSEFINGSIMSTMSEEQQNAVIALKNLHESALALRGTQGLGQASDQVRRAITGMLPNATSADIAYMMKQLQTFRGSIRELKKGVPTLGGPQPPQQSPSGGRGGRVSQDEIRRRLSEQQ